MFDFALRAFHQTVRAGSVRKASEELGLSASSVSRQIAILERQFGTKLFTRTASGMSLTYAGRLVADFSRSVLTEYDGLRTDLNDLQGRTRAEITIASVANVATIIPMRAMTTFFKEFPGVSFKVFRLLAPEVLKAVRSGEADIGIAFCPQYDPIFKSLAKIPEPVVVASPPGMLRWCKGTISLADIGKYSIAVPDAGSGIRALFEDEMREAGLGFSPLASANSFEVIKEFVLQGNGLGILPRGAVLREVESGLIDVSRIENDRLDAAFVEYIRLSDRRVPNVMKHFIDHLRRQTILMK